MCMVLWMEHSVYGGGDRREGSATIRGSWIWMRSHLSGDLRDEQEQPDKERWAGTARSVGGASSGPVLLTPGRAGVEGEEEEAEEAGVGRLGASCLGRLGIHPRALK